MIYLEGLGRSTQIGDFSAFFISVSLFCIIGSLFKNISFLFSAVIILSSAAIMRIVSWQLYDADFSRFLHNCRNNYNYYDFIKYNYYSFLNKILLVKLT